MRIKIVTTCDNENHEGYLKLKASLEKHGYDFEMIHSRFEFGHQLPVIYQWCKDYQGDCTHILYTDAFDTIAFGGPNELAAKVCYGDDSYWFYNMVISAEKACYPHPERAGEYPLSYHPWKYVNGGGWFAGIEFFKGLCEKESLGPDSHDQVWLMEAYLKNQSEIAIDRSCRIFQTLAFSEVSEWEMVNGRPHNIETNTDPLFFHGNGRTDMQWLY